MKHLITIVVCVFLFLPNLKAQDSSNQTSSLETFYGCWDDTDTQEWTLGLFENFAVYEDDFWTYQYRFLDKRNGSVEINLYKGTEKRTFKLKRDKKSDSICIASFPEKRKLKLHRPSTQQEFRTEDHRTFSDNNFQKDSVTIVGYLRHAEKRKRPFSVSFKNIYSNEQVEYFADIDSLGRFRLTFPVENTTSVFIDWKQLRILDVVEPGEKIFLYQDYKKYKPRFMGKNARLHRELRDFSLYPPYKNNNKYVSYKDSSSHAVFMQKEADIYKEKEDILEEYISVRPFLSDRFKQYYRSYLLMDYASDLMQRRFLLRRIINKEFFAPSYINHVDSLFLRVAQPYTLMSSTMTFLDDYIGYYASIYSNACTFSTVELFRYLNEEKKYPLTKQQISDLDAYEKGMCIAVQGQSAKKDSLEIDSLIKPYKEGLLRANTLLRDSCAMGLYKKYESYTPFLMGRKALASLLTAFEKIKAPQLLKELTITKAVYDKLEREKKPLSEQYLAYIKPLVTNERFRNVLSERQDIYANLDKQSIDYIESLKRTDHLKDSKDADKLWQKLIEPYKGKVIYVDVWGTWCAPCRMEMKQMPPVKEAMKGKDVIFMYFASGSSEDSWKNFIKETHLTGPNIVHYNLPPEQQQMLERRFGINSFPTFMLIDKEGNIVDMKPPRPSQTKELINRLNKLLSSF